MRLGEQSSVDVLFFGVSKFDGWAGFDLVRPLSVFSGGRFGIDVRLLPAERAVTAKPRFKSSIVLF